MLTTATFGHSERQFTGAAPGTHTRATGRQNAAPPAAWSSLADEQAELLDAITKRMSLSLGEYDPCAEAEIYLLGHLSLQ